MALLGLLGDFFSLDIGTTSIRAVELRGSGAVKSLEKYTTVNIDKNISRSDAPADKRKVADAIQALVTQAGITTRNVVVGIPSSKTFITIVDLVRLPEKEMESSVLYQADQYLPMSPQDAKIDWAILGDSPLDPNKVEVLLASVTNEYAEERLNMLESISLNVSAMEPDQFALVRSLVPHGFMDAVMILDMGWLATDLVAVYQGTPRLMRSIPTGGDALIKAAVQNLNIDEDQATQFVNKFGLVQNKMEGQVYKALSGVVDSLILEVDKSIKFFNTRYQQTAKITKIIVTGRLATLPEFPLYLVNHTQLPVEIGNSWLNVRHPQSQSNELASISHQYAVAVGLAERLP